MIYRDLHNSKICKKKICDTRAFSCLSAMAIQTITRGLWISLIFRTILSAPPTKICAFLHDLAVIFFSIAQREAGVPGMVHLYAIHPDHEPGRSPAVPYRGPDAGSPRKFFKKYVIFMIWVRILSVHMRFYRAAIHNPIHEGSPGTS